MSAPDAVVSMEWGDAEEDGVSGNVERPWSRVMDGESTFAVFNSTPFFLPSPSPVLVPGHNLSELALPASDVRHRRRAPPCASTASLHLDCVGIFIPPPTPRPRRSSSPLSRRWRRIRSRRLRRCIGRLEILMGRGRRERWRTRRRRRQDTTSAAHRRRGGLPCAASTLKALHSHQSTAESGLVDLVSAHNYGNQDRTA